MTRITPILHGMYPRDEDVVQVTRDYDRERASWEAVEAAYRTQREDVVTLQEEHGFPYLSDGQLSWPHYFHPFTQGEAVGEGSLTRFVDTNTFFRRPVVEDADREPPPLHQTGDTVTLPGPHFFYRSAENLSTEDAVNLLPGLYDAVCTQLDAAVIQYTEPAFAFQAEHQQYTEIGLDEDDYHVLAAYDEILGQTEKEVIHFPHGNVFSTEESVVEELLDSRAAIGVDLYNRQGFCENRLNAFSVYDVTEEDIYLGVIRGDAVDTEKHEVSASVSRFLREEEPGTVYIGPNVHLSLLPAAVAEGKVKTITGFVDQLRNEVVRGE